jgi:fucose 4-O-acetylase-like acetyltransferase
MTTLAHHQNHQTHHQPRAHQLPTAQLPGAQLSAAQLAAATPASRERYVDFLRAASIVSVVFGHWLMAVVVWRHGHFSNGNSISVVPGLWTLTWVLQVMPVFFFVGGFANLVTLDGLRRRGAGYTEYITGRARRLLRPMLVLVAVWVPMCALLPALGVPEDVVKRATTLVSQPLWFIGVYLIVVALAPVMLSLHRRHGVRVLGALAGAAIVVDALRFGTGVDVLGYLNIAFVWLFAHQLGFFYADGRLRSLSRQQLWGFALAGFSALVFLTGVLGYPSSMVGLPGERISNMSPPTVCILALTVLQVALVMLVRDRAAAMLERPKAWTRVVALNGVIMTVFLWHLTALLLVVTITFPAGFPQPAAGTALWWVTRPVWIAMLLCALAGLVAVFSRIERPRAETPPRAVSRSNAPTRPNAPARSDLRAIAGVILVIVAVTGIANTGLVGLTSTHATLVVLPVTPLQNLLTLAAGLLCLARRPATSRTSAAANSSRA